MLQLSFIGWYLPEGLILTVGFIVALYFIVSSIASSITWYLNDLDNLMFIPAMIVFVVCSVIIFIINLWLTPYRTGCEAHFYLCASGGIQPNPYQPGPYGGQSGPRNNTPYGHQPPSQSTLAAQRSQRPPNLKE